MLPAHLPPWPAVYWCFRRFVRLLLFRTIPDVALMIGREPSLTDRRVSECARPWGRYLLGLSYNEISQRAAVIKPSAAA